MSRVQCLSAPFLFLLLVLSLLPSPSQSALPFIRTCGAAPWSRRANANAENMRRTVQWTSLRGVQQEASNTLVLQGNDNAVENDVWISSDQGRTWDLIAGIGRVDGGSFPAPNGFDTSSFTPVTAATAFTTDSQSRIFRISGQTSNPWESGTCVSSTWMSTDGKTWQDQSTRLGATTITPARKFAAGMADMADRLYVLGGIQCDNWQLLRDLWMSTDSGIHWTRQTTTLPMAGPSVGILLDVPTASRSGLGFTDALVYATGWDNQLDYNDVWLSTDRGVNWQLVNRGAAFTNRDDGNGEVTRDGIIVIVGGKRGVLNTAEILNDVWVSPDGGYSWSMCVLDAAWDDRRYQTTALDQAGYLYVMAGLASDGSRLNDVWRSEISFNNLPAVEAACGITPPPCGYGLTCLPSDPTTRRLSRGVTCAASVACGGTVVETSLDFLPQTTRANWGARDVLFVGLLREQQPYRTPAGIAQTAPSNSFILYGTATYSENDVWISTDRMESWTLVAGVSVTGLPYGGRAASPADTTSFNPVTLGPAYAIDAHNRVYRISGELSPGGGCTQDVWMSTGGITWTRYTPSNSFTPRMWASAVASSQDNSVYLIGGRTCSGVEMSLFDVWRSVNFGQSWVRQSQGDFPAGGPRNGMAGIYRSPVLNREIITYAGGWDGNTDYNDVHVSSDQGQTWAAVTLAAQWRRRDDMAGLVTPQGVVVMVGGKTAMPDGSELFHNDIWVSMDGGYSWGVCTEDLAFSDRRYESVTMDEDGFLYVVAGETNDLQRREYLNDAWRSTLNFTDYASLAATCGVTVPQCGAGLNCWPTAAGTQRLPGNRGVTCPGCGSTAAVPPLGFFRMGSSTAPWSARSHANIELYPKTIAYTPVGSSTQVTVRNALVLQGHTNGQENDIWVSTDHGASWQLVGGISIFGRSGLVRATSPADTRSFTPVTSQPGFALDSRNSIIYRIGGWAETLGACYGGIVSSSDGKTWAVQNGGVVNGITPFREYPAAIVDTVGNVYVSGGRRCASDGGGLNDVWRSTDRGRSWTLRTANAPFGPRLTHSLLNMRNSLMLGGQDILLSMGGWTGNQDRNDVWASSDGGARWELITLGAGWESRDDMNAEVTAAGLIVLAGGKGERPGVAQPDLYNDVWVSADGGYSWGRCVGDADFSDRRYQMTVLDEAGFLIVAGGLGLNDEPLNDVWRSSFSFTNMVQVRAACGVRVPSCGIGLSCLPSSAGFRRLSGNNGVHCTACPNNVGSNSLDFVRLSGQAPWSARDHGNVQLMVKQVTYTPPGGATTRSLANSLILHGNANSVENDVWLSSDHGVTWQLIAGISVSGRSGRVAASGAAATSSFSPDNFAPATAVDSSNWLYRIQGLPPNSETCSQDVWVSSNGVQWINQYRAAASRRITPARIYAAAVGTSDGKVFVAGGAPCPEGAGLTLNDVWMSTNRGVDWSLQTLRAPWQQRSVLQLLSVPSSRLGVNMLVVLSGWLGTGETNDVWASSDDGRSWRLLTAAAPWARRDDAQAVATTRGLIVLTGGKTDSPYELHNDLWVSADGGFTWGRCLQDAAFTDRRYQMTALDESDYLYVIGGDQAGRPVNDVWRSSTPFSDLNTVAAACSIRMPVCGPGLNCWPGSPGFRVNLNNGQGATCDACSLDVDPGTVSGDGSSSTGTIDLFGSSSGLGTGAVLGIIILIVFAAVALWFAYKYWQRVGVPETKVAGAEGLLDGETSRSDDAATETGGSTGNGYVAPSPSTATS